MKCFPKLFIALLFTLIFHTKISLIECSIIVHSPSTLSGKSIYATSLKFHDDENLLISGSVVKANPLGACSKLKNTNINNNTIVLYSGNLNDGNCRPSERLKNILHSGAAGCIVYWNGFLSGHGLFTYTYDLDGVNDVEIFGVEMKFDEEFINAVFDHKNVSVTITSDKNGYQKVEQDGGFDAFSVLFSLYAAACIAFASWKLYCFHKVGARWSVPQISLSFEVIGATLRILHTVDPYWIRGYYPFWLGSFLISASIPFAFMSVLLITFYWEECLRKMTVKVFPNLDKMRYPFIGASVLLVILEFSSSLARGLRANSIPWLLRATAVMYALIAFATFAFFIYTGIKVLRVLLASKAVNTKRAGAVKKLTLLVMLNGILLAVFVIITGSAGFVETKSASLTVFVWSLAIAIIQTVGLVQISSFKPPSSQSSASKSPSYNQTVVSRVASSNPTANAEQQVTESKDEDFELASPVTV